MQIKIQKIFTKIRNKINEKEDKLLLEVSEKFGEIYFDENMVIKFENIPEIIKSSFEKGKKINEEWNDDNKLHSLLMIV